MLIDNRLPFESRVVWNLSLVRPAIPFAVITDDIRCAAAITAGDRPDDLGGCRPEHISC